MRNKKGFTLIELLAVIVIIGVIGTIVSFSVYQIMETIRKNAFESSVRSIFEATDLYKKSKDMEVLDRTYDIKSDSGLLTIDKNTFNTESDAPKGLIHDYGNEIYVENITDGNYCATGSDKNLVVRKGDCSSILNVRIENVKHGNGYKSIDENGNEITVYDVDISSEASKDNGVKYNFYISEDNITFKNLENESLGGNTYKFIGLEGSKEYYFKVEVVEGEKKATSEVVKYKIDENNVSPVITFSTVSETKLSGYSYYQELTRKFTVIDNSGINEDSIYYCITNSSDVNGCNPIKEGIKAKNEQEIEFQTSALEQYICVSATDNKGLAAVDKAGNTVICDKGRFRVDNTAPTKVRDNGSFYVFLENKMYLSATANELESGIKKIEFSINGGAWKTATTYNAPAGNKYNIRVRVTNGAGIVSYSNENLITLSTKPKINTPTYHNSYLASGYSYYQRINTHTNAISQIPLREVKYCRTTGSTCTPNLWASITNSYSSYINVDYQTNAYATKICFQARNDVGWSDKVCSNSYRVDGTRPVNLSGDAWHSTTKNAAHISGTGYDYESGVRSIQYAATGVGYSGNYIVGVSCDIGTYGAYIRVINNSGLYTDMLVKYLTANVCCNLPAIGAGCTNPGEVVDCYGTIRTCSIQHSTGWWTPTAHSGGWFSQYQMEGGLLQTGLCTGYSDPDTSDNAGYYVSGQVFNSGGLDANFNAYPMAYISGNMIYDHYSLSGPKNHHSAYCSYNTYYAWS